MLIQEQLQKKELTKYRLSKESGVPQATINDICSGKADLEKARRGLYTELQKCWIVITSFASVSLRYVLGKPDES